MTTETDDLWPARIRVGSTRPVPVSGGRSRESGIVLRHPSVLIAARVFETVGQGVVLGDPGAKFGTLATGSGRPGFLGEAHRPR